MATGAMFCVHLVFVAVAIYCPASAQTNTYYDMTRGFLDVIQPMSHLGGMNRKHNANAKYMLIKFI